MAARILVIDDHHDSAEMMGELLSRQGFDVEVCHSGASGVRAARRVPPDAVICDLVLGDMDGFEVARTLRDDPRTGHARLIAVSGRGEPEARRRALEAGFVRHLVKPVVPGSLKRHLDDVLGRHRNDCGA